MCIQKEKFAFIRSTMSLKIKFDQTDDKAIF